jgi:hypothetical protein
MSILIKIKDEQSNEGRTKDSIKYKKDCWDFRSLEDGTIVGEHRYCGHSSICRQIDVLANGKVMPMEGHYLPMLDPITGEVVSHELFCTGMHDLRPHKERMFDDKIS